MIYLIVGVISNEQSMCLCVTEMTATTTKTGRNSSQCLAPLYKANAMKITYKKKIQYIFLREAGRQVCVLQSSVSVIKQYRYTINGSRDTKRPTAIYI